MLSFHLFFNFWFFIFRPLPLFFRCHFCLESNLKQQSTNFWFSENHILHPHDQYHHQKESDFGVKNVVGFVVVGVVNGVQLLLLLFLNESPWALKKGLKTMKQKEVICCGSGGNLMRPLLVFFKEEYERE